MRYRDTERRLAALETAQEEVDTGNDGYAPEAWTRLAPWALLVHDAGGWDAAIAALNAGTLPKEPNPYGRLSGGPLWDITLYWQKGDTRRFLDNTAHQTALWVIAFCVSDLLEQGMSRAEIKQWRTGRMIWDAVVQAVEEARNEER